MSTEHSKTCPVCMGKFKIANELISVHDQKGTKQLCPGSEQKPWEESTEGAVNYVRGAKFYIGELEDEIRAHEGGEVEKIFSLDRDDYVFKGSGDEYDSLIAEKVREYKTTIFNLGQVIEQVEARIEGWAAA